MSWKTNLASIALACAAAVLAAQQPQEAPAPGTTSSTRTTTTMQQNPDGSTSTSTKTVTVTGEVVTYEPGHTIVIREPNKGTVTYTLDPGLTVPADIQVGRRVMIYTEPGDGSVRVSRITTVTAPARPAGDANAQTMSSQGRTTTSTTSATDTDSSAAAAKTMQTTTTTSTRATTVTGTVQAYEPGQSITVVGPNSKTTTYTITTDSQLPKDVAIGKRVTVQTTVVSGKPVVRTVQYKTTTKTVHTKTVSPQ